jgi:hypothetical protein
VRFKDIVIDIHGKHKRKQKLSNRQISVLQKAVASIDEIDKKLKPRVSKPKVASPFRKINGTDKYTKKVDQEKPSKVLLIKKPR